MPFQQGLNDSLWADCSGNSMTAPTLNPSIPSFQPNGSEMQRYQTPRTSGIKDMQKYMVDMNVSHTSDMVRLQYATGQNTKDIETLHKIFKNDLTTLEKKMREFEVSMSRDDSPAPEDTMRTIDYTPTEDMLSGFSTDELAQAYTREAEEKEKVAMRLRQQAAALGGEQYHMRQTKLLDGSPLQGAPEAELTPETAKFACCETNYGSLSDLLEHVEKSHASSRKAPSAMPTQETPIRATPRARSRAVEIQAPEDVSPRSEKSKADFAVEMPPKTYQTAPAATNTPPWMPVTVRDMKPISFETPDHKETFSFEFIRSELGGSLWCSGFYYEHANSILPSKTYWILELDREPFLPKSPGEHGAKLTPFFNETKATEAPDPENYMDAAVFIADKAGNGYRYYGHYSQTRFSDKVDYDSIVEHVPEKTLRQWAEHLGATGRPEWVTLALMNHFWPMPKYNGLMPTDSALNTPATGQSNETSGGGIERRVTAALQDYAQDLKEWEKDARVKVNHLNPDAILQAFKHPDSDVEPGLRLWWEYMECINYDTAFYEFLVKIKQNPKLSRRAKPKGAIPPPRASSSRHLETLEYDKPLTEAEIEALPTYADLHPEPIEPTPPPSPPRDIKRLQHEQWANVNRAAEVERPKQPTRFVKGDWGNDDNTKPGKKQAKTMQSHLRKAGAEAKKPAPAAKSHSGSVKPRETSKVDGKSDGKAGGPDGKADGKTTGQGASKANGPWDGVGDMQTAKEFHDEVQDGRWKTGAGAGAGGKGLPPHLRRKGRS